MLNMSLLKSNIVVNLYSTVLLSVHMGIRNSTDNLQS